MHNHRVTPVSKRHFLMSRPIILLLLLPLAACSQGRKLKKAAQAVFANTPMSCRIEGRILRVLPPQTDDKTSLCSKHPCTARVLINDVSACGSAVSLPLNAGDTVTITFSYTLDATSKLFPAMKVQYPGLKKGDVFKASAEQRLVMGGEGQFVVTAYSRK
jgi:hypothetical protein